MGSGVVFPDNMPFYHKTNKSSTIAGFVLNNSGSACGVAGFTGTLTHASEIHELRVSFVKGGLHDSTANKDNWNVGFTMLTAASPSSQTNGSPGSDKVGASLNTISSGQYMYWEDVGVSFQGTMSLTYGDSYWLPTINFTGVHTVTGTAGVTTYAYYPWWWNNQAQNVYIGRAYSSQTAPNSTLTLVKTKG
jgi:hypothetical protein